MTKLIPLDAAIVAAKSLFRLHTTGLYGAASVQQCGLLTETAEAALRAIPTIDPAAIREAAMKEALDAVSRAAWKHNGDDSYSAGLEDGARNQNEADYDAILALIGEKK